MNVIEYLKRIGCEDCLAPSPVRLAELQRGHLLRVPYESLDIYRGVVPDLSEDALYEKIVLRRRGGYCFELNGLFGALLRRLGYDVTQHFGRWLYGESLAVPPPRHRVLRVKFPQATYITDVGIGMWSPMAPLRFAYGEEQTIAGRTWRIARDARLLNVVQTRLGEKWFNYFSFGDDPAEDVDFVYVNQYLAHAPESPFRRGLLVHLPTEDGDRRISLELDPETGLFGWRYEEFRADGTRETRFLHTDAQRAETLRIRFGLEWAAK